MFLSDHVQIVIVRFDLIYQDLAPYKYCHYYYYYYHVQIVYVSSKDVRRPT